MQPIYEPTSLGHVKIPTLMPGTTIIEKIEWIETVQHISGLIKWPVNDLRAPIVDYVSFNSVLQEKILDDKVLAKFKTKRIQEDRLANIVNFYSVENNRDAILKEATELKQGDRSLTDYFNYKLRWMRVAIADISDEQFLSEFIKGIRKEDAAQVGFDVKGVTLPDFEKKLIFIEKYNEATDQTVNAIEIVSLKKENEELKSQLNQLQAQVNNLSLAPKKKEKDRRKCKICNERRPNKGYPYCQQCYFAKFAGKSRNLNADRVTERVNAIDSTAFDGMYSFSLSKESKFVQLHSDIYRLKCMIDTGASISLAKSSINYIGERSVDIRIKFANNQFTNISKQRKYRIFKDNVPIVFWAYVYDSIPTDILLGKDFLDKKAIIDLVSNKLWLKDENEFSINLLSEDDIWLSELEFPVLRGLKGTDDWKPVLDEAGMIDPSKSDIYHNGEINWRGMISFMIRKFKILERDLGGWVFNSTHTFSIDVDPDAVPYFAKPTSFHGDERKELEKTILFWLEKGIIRPCDGNVKSYWGHDLVVAQQMKLKDKGYEPGFRVCPNLIPLNRVTKPMNYPLPNPRQVVNNLTGVFKTLIDGSKGYLRFKLDEQSKHFTAFVLDQPIPGFGRHFEFNFMPWGATNAGRFYQKYMDDMYGPNVVIANRTFARNMLGECLEVFQDDSLIHHNDERQHFMDVYEALERMFCSGLMPNWEKTKVRQTEVVYAGMLLTPEGIRQDPRRVEALSLLSYPKTYKELDIFIGMANWHRQFIRDYATLMKPLLDLQMLDRRKFRFAAHFKWVHKITFRKFIQAIKKDTLLNRPGPGVYHTYVDMSEKNATLSAHLIRTHLGKEYLMGYASKRLTKEECCYSTPKLEFMAIWFGAMKFSDITSGFENIIFTDHRTLQGLHLKNPRKRWATWLSDLIELGPKVVHISRDFNPVADAMTKLSKFFKSINSVLVVTNESDKKEIVQNYHLHLSDRKTVMNIRQKYNWEGIYADVKDYRENCCEYCIRNKGMSAEYRNPLTPIVADSVWKVLGLDIKGPVRLRSGESKQYLVVVDYFSKNTFLISLKQYNAEEIWKKLESHVLSKLSGTEHIVGDRASQFLAKDIAIIKDKYGISFTPSTAFHHQANGEVENRIKLIDGIVHSFLQDGYSFRDALSFAQNKINHEIVSDATKFTPYEILNGVKFVSPFDKHISSRIKGLTKVHDEVRENIVLSKQTQKFYYDKGKKVRTFDEGDWVMTVNFAPLKYYEDKRLGPFKIEKVLPHDNYLVFNHYSFKWLQVNVQFLQLYKPSIQSKFKYSKSVSVPANQIPIDDDPIMLSPLNQNVHDQNVPVQNDAALMPNDNMQDLIGKRIRVWFLPKNQPEGKGRYHKGEVVRAGDIADNYVVKFDHKAKEEIVELKPNDRTVDVANSDRWSLL
jgi:hypothetical protein